MKDFNKYKLLSEGKAFGDRAKIALLLLDSSTAYEELKDEGAQTSVAGSYGCIGGDPASILEMLTIELICRNPRDTWYLPDDVKYWDRRFGSLFETKFFCYDDDVEIWCTLSEYLSQSRFKMRLQRRERDKTGKAEITRDRANLTRTILRVCDSNNEKNGQNFISVFEVMKNKGIIG